MDKFVTDVLPLFGFLAFLLMLGKLSYECLTKSSKQSYETVLNIINKQNEDIKLSIEKSNKVNENLHEINDVLHDIDNILNIVQHKLINNEIVKYDHDLSTVNCDIVTVRQQVQMLLAKM